MTEPTFTAETDPKAFNNHVELKQWVNKQTESVKAAGCNHIRITNDPAAVGRVLLEAWPTKPQDEGRPRWKIPND